METVDEEFEAAAVKFIRQAHKDGKPFFVWFNSTRMHIWTHLQPKSQGVTGLGVYPDGMVEHDAMVGRLLGLLDSSAIDPAELRAGLWDHAEVRIFAVNWASLGDGELKHRLREIHSHDRQSSGSIHVGLLLVER